MKNKKVVSVILYIMTAALAVFYIATLVLGQKRDVSAEYDLYYVDGKLSKWPGEKGLDYKFGDTEIYDMSKLEEYKRLLEEEKIYGTPTEQEDSEDEKDSGKEEVISNRDSAIDKYFERMIAAQNSSSDSEDDKKSDTDDEEKTVSTATLTIPYRYSKGFYSMHTGLYTTKENEASLYYRFINRMQSDIVLEVYGASYNTATKVYANDTYIGTIEAYENVEDAVMYHKDEYGDRIREDKVNDNLNRLTIPIELVDEEGMVKLTFVPEDAVSIYNYSSAIGNDNFKKYKGFRITSINMYY